MTNRAQLERNTEEAIRDANRAKIDTRKVTPRGLKELEADISAMLHQGQSSQDIIDTNIKFGYASQIGLPTLLAYVANNNLDSDLSLGKAGVAIQLVMDKFYNKRAACDARPIK